jgi:hypothetical protein
MEVKCVFCAVGTEFLILFRRNLRFGGCNVKDHISHSYEIKSKVIDTAVFNIGS